MGKIGIVGLGYIGINLAYYSSKKYDVIGYDTDKNKISLFKKGIDPTKEIGENITKTKISYTSDSKRLKECDIIIICVPTPEKNKKPDLKYIKEATLTVAENLKKGAIIVYESTVAPSTTSCYCKELIESKNLKYNEDFFLGYSPERINPQDKVNKIYNTYKIVSSDDENTLNKLVKFYKNITPYIHMVNSTIVAEATKLIENVQRDVNIAFMNEISKYLSIKNIPSKEVYEAMNTKWNSLKFNPGLVGGHCIGVDPYYLIDDAKNNNLELELVKNARMINESVVDRIISKIDKEQNIGILGFSYKKNSNDIRNTKVVDIYNKLLSKNKNVFISDYCVDKDLVKKEYGINLVDKLNELDYLIIATNHDLYDNISKEDLNQMFRGKIKIFDVYGIINDKIDLEVENL